MDPSELLNLINNKVPSLIFGLFLIIAIKLLIKVLRDENIIKIYDLILQRIAEGVIIILIPLLMHIYLSYYAEMSVISLFALYITSILGIAIALIEIKDEKSPITKRIENENINNLLKTIIKSVIEKVPFALSIIMLLTILLLIKSPTNEILISIMLVSSTINLAIVLADAAAATIITSIKDLPRQIDIKTPMNP